MFSTLPSAAAGAEAAAEDAGKEIPGLKAEIQITGNRPPIAHHEDAEMLARVKAAVAQATGKEPVVAAFTAFTDTEKSVAISIKVHNTQVNAIADFFIHITSHESGVIPEHRPQVRLCS